MLCTYAKQEILHHVVQIKEPCHNVVWAKKHGMDSYQKLRQSHGTRSQSCTLNPQSEIFCLNRRERPYWETLLQSTTSSDQGEVEGHQQSLDSGDW